MPCDSQRAPRQTEAERLEEVRQAVEALKRGIMAKRVALQIDAAGRVSLSGDTSPATGARLSDACTLRKVLATMEGKAALLKAEQATGIRARVVQGGGGRGGTIAVSLDAGARHSHDGGLTWHDAHDPADRMLAAIRKHGGE